MKPKIFVCLFVRCTQILVTYPVFIVDYLYNTFGFGFRSYRFFLLRLIGFLGSFILELFLNRVNTNVTQYYYC